MNLNREKGASAGKLKTVPELAEIVAALKRSGQQVAHCHGVFDLVHPGHIRHLKAARAEGDALIVTVTADRFVNKGPGRPAFNERLRVEALAAIGCVDYVAINEAPTAVELIKTLRPYVYVKGADYIPREQDPTGAIYEEEQAVLSVGGRIHFTDEIAFSSSHLINVHLDNLPAETETWLKEIRSRRSLDEVLGYMEGATNLRALVIGEPIIDEYVFCNSLGKSTKDPVLAVQYHSMESHAGGALAVANHLGGLVGEVGLIAQIGEVAPREEFMREHLLPNVVPRFHTRRNAPTIHKRRFIDHYTGARMLELYVMQDRDPDPDDVDALVKEITELADGYDLVVVADYGHGMMARAATDAVVNKARFLVVNTQANAGNRGFNTISKYRRADYVCLSVHEVELETRMRHEPFSELVKEVVERIDCPRFTITRGKMGTVHFDRGGPLVEVPAFATHVTDRIGAGDAVLAVTAALVAQGAPWDIVGFVGNIAGAQLVAELGNRVSVNRPSLVKSITALMK